MVKLIAFQQQYTTEPQMSTKQSGKSQVTVCRPDQEQLTGPAKQYQLRAFEDIKQEAVELKQQGIYLFEQWVANIYKFKAKTTDLNLLYQGIEISISPTAVESILRKVLAEVCETHRALIGDEMMIILKAGSGEYYYKIDADQPGIGFFDNLNDEWEITEGTIQEDNFQPDRLTVNQQFYQYCVWVIYHHYCSLSQCNKQIRLLVELIRQNSSEMYLKLYKHLQSKKIKNQDSDSDDGNDSDEVAEFQAKENPNMSEIQKMISLIDNYDLVKQSQLNILTIMNLIPLAMVKFDDHISSNKLPHDQIEKTTEDMQQHINKFQVSINSIIYKNKQNMRKFLNYFDEFKRAIKIIRNRLKNSKGSSKKQIVLSRHLRGLKQEKQRSLNYKLFGQKQFEQEIAQKIERQMQLQELCEGKVFIGEDQAELVRNIDNLQFKQNGQKILQKGQKSKLENKSKNFGLDRQIFKSHEFSQSKIHERITNFKQMAEKQQRNSFLYNISDKSNSHFSAKLTQRSSDELKFQVIFKNYQQSYQSINKFQYTQNLKKVKSERVDYIKKQFFQEGKNKKTEPLQITQQLKRKLSNLIRTKTDEQFINEKKKLIKVDNQTNFRQRQSCVLREEQNKLIYYSKQQKSELNFHQFLQQNKFKHDLDDNQIDEDIFQQKRKQQQLKDQIKKKKKKLKKKKNKKQSQIEENHNEDDKIELIQNSKQKNYIRKQIDQDKLKLKLMQAIRVNHKQSQTQKQKQNKKKTKIKVSDMLINEITEKQYDVIKNLEQMKIEQQNRNQCYFVSEQNLIEMKQRQIDILSRQKEVCEKSPNKQKVKNKKNRNN